MLSSHVLDVLMPKQVLQRDIPGTPEYIHRQQMRKTYNARAYAKISQKSKGHKCTHLCRHKDRDIVHKKDVVKPIKSFSSKLNREDVKEFLSLWRKGFTHKCNYLLEHSPRDWQPIAKYLHYDTNLMYGETEVNNYLKTKFENIDDI